jgi:DNA-binding MarR family transcriptional regulator
MSSKQEHLGWLIKSIQHGHHRALDKKLAPLGISLVQWNALREIDRNPGCSQHQLAEHTFNSDQAIGTLLTRLQAAGWIERQPGAGRASLHELTAAGRALLREGQKVMFEVTNASFGRLSAGERDELVRLLSKVLEGRGQE